MKSRIKSAATLSQSDIVQLLNRNLLALRVYPFGKVETCIEWQSALKATTMLNRYSNALDVPVNRIGMTLFETENEPEKLQQYLIEGEHTRSKVRSIFGTMNPLDYLIKMINKSWSKGCQIQTLSGQKMNPGIIRSFEPSCNGGLPPHVDSLLKDLPHTSEFEDMQCQLAANFYFDVSEIGGALEIWDFEPSQSELESLYSGNYDFIDRTKIPVASYLIKPKIGELILFRSKCIHSVTKSEIGERTAASCFIGYYNCEMPLKIWA